MIWLLLLILLILAFGVWGAIKLTFWVRVVALVVALIAGASSAAASPPA